jgi:hypothetical protein
MRLVLLLGLGLGIAGPVSAQQSKAPATPGDPLAFLARFWRGAGCEPIDPGRGGRGQPSRREIFTPEIVSLAQRAEARQPRDEPGGLEFGFLSLSQDCYGGRPRLSLSPQAPHGTAEVTASFEVAPGSWMRSETILYRLVPSGGGWRVAEVVRTVLDDRQQTRRDSLLQVLRREASGPRR